jgi:deazaflavin-dependent oxidoreductase (nitroreductase family)
MTNDWNRAIIEEFRAHGGKVGGAFAGATILLLTSTGAKSGRAHTTPLVCHLDDDRLVVIASKGGAPTNPAWYHNLVAHPAATVEVGSETFKVTASVVTGDERDRLYGQQAKLFPAFAEYEKRTTRKIPVIVLARGD